MTRNTILLVWCSVVVSTAVFGGNYGPIETLRTYDDKNKIAYISGEHINPFSISIKREGYDGLHILDFSNGETKSIDGPLGSKTTLEYLNLNADYSYLAFLAQYGLYLFDTTNKSYHEVYKTLGHPVKDYVWSPDGSKIAFIIAEGNARFDDSLFIPAGVGIYDLENGSLEILNIKIHTLFWATHDNLLYGDKIGFQGNEIITIDPVTGLIKSTGYSDLFFSPSGDYLVDMSNPVGADTVIRMSKTGDVVAVLKQNEGMDARQVRWVSNSKISGRSGNGYAVFDVELDEYIVKDIPTEFIKESERKLSIVNGYRVLAFGFRKILVIDKSGFSIVDFANFEVFEYLPNSLFQTKGFCFPLEEFDIPCQVKSKDELIRDMN